MNSILIDGSFFMHRTAKSLFSREGDVSDERLLEIYFRDLKSFLLEVEQFTSCVFYVLDCKSWRKGVDSNYKGNRINDDDYSIKTNRVHNKMLISLSEMKINILKVDNCEADDVIYKWSKYLSDRDCKVLIFSEDRDLQQLLNKNVFLYKPIQRKIVISDDTKSTHLTDLSDWITSKELTIEDMNIEKFIFEKILVGDKGDNVGSIHDVLKNNRTYRFTSAMANRTIEIFKLNKDVNNLLNDYELNHLNICVNQILKNPSLDFRTKIKNNYQLMVLNELAYPQYILENLNNSLKTKILKYG